MDRCCAEGNQTQAPCWSPWTLCRSPSTHRETCLHPTPCPLSPRRSLGAHVDPPSLGPCPCAISELGSQQGPTSLVILELGSCPNTATLEDGKLPTAFSQAEGREPSTSLTTFMWPLSSKTGPPISVGPCAPPYPEVRSHAGSSASTKPNPSRWRAASHPSAKA